MQTDPPTEPAQQVVEERSAVLYLAAGGGCSAVEDSHLRAPVDSGSSSPSDGASVSLGVAATEPAASVTLADGAVGAGGAGGESLLDSAAVVAETEGVAANADDSTVVGASLAVAAAACRGAGSARAAGDGGGRSSGSSSGGLGDDNGGHGGSGVRGRSGTGGEDTRSAGSRSRASGRGRGSGGSGSRGTGAGVRARARATAVGVQARVAVANGGGADRVTVLNAGARVGELEDTLAGRAGIGDVGNEHVGKGVVVVVAVRATGDRNGSAVHVHLAVADLVEPGPGESSLTGLELLGDLDRVLLDTVVAALARALLAVRAAIRVGAGGRDVAGSRGGAATDHGVDDLPLGLVSRRGVLVGHGDLARTTTVDGRASEAEGGVVTSGDLGGRGARVVAGISATLAREGIGGAVERAALDLGGAVGRGVVHDHVGRGRAEEAQSHSEHSLGVHFEGMCCREVFER